MPDQNTSIGELTYWNEWWKTGEFPPHDSNLRDWSQSTFKWIPRLMKTFEKEDILYTLRGPRRIGKTTLLKLKIKDLLEEGVPPENVFYYPCDLLETPRQLAAIIETYLFQQRASEGRAYLFIDEVSSLKDWQKAIKLLFDMDRFRDCTVILTGSHSIDLREASETLAGRRGHVDRLKYRSPDKVLLPAKFSEYVETLDETLHREIEKLQLFHSEKRKEVFHELAYGRIPPEVKSLDPFTKDLNRLLDRYLITGGVAQVIHQYTATRKIVQDTYDVFISHVVRDLYRWRHHEVRARQILRAIIETTASRVSWNRLKGWTDIADSRTVEDYANIFEDSFVVRWHYLLNLEMGTPYYRKDKKIYVRDPFIFHACRGWIYGRDAFDFGREFLSSPENKSKLAESVVGEHLSRLMFIVHPDPHFKPSNHVFYWKSEKDKEVDFVIRLEDKFLPIEVKCSDTVKREDEEGLYDFLKAPHAHDFGIITSVNQLNARREYTIVPLSILLLLT